MTNKKTLKDTHWGYQNCQELFDGYIKPKFEALKFATNYSEYYDYISGVGIFRNWRYKGKVGPKHIETVYQVWNNIKHETLDKRHRRSFYVEEEFITVFLCENEAKFWDDLGKWDDLQVGEWKDAEEKNESGAFSWKVKIVETNKKSSTVMYLYELCKRAYEEIKEVL